MQEESGNLGEGYIGVVKERENSKMTISAAVVLLQHKANTPTEGNLQSQK